MYVLGRVCVYMCVYVCVCVCMWGWKGRGEVYHINGGKACLKNPYNLENLAELKFLMFNFCILVYISI